MTYRVSDERLAEISQRIAQFQLAFDTDGEPSILLLHQLASDARHLLAEVEASRAAD